MVSLRRDLTGFAIGTGLGVAVGLLLGLSRIADRIFTRWFNGLKQIALLAWIPLISIWFGFDESAKVVFVALAAAIPVILNIVEGIRLTSRKIIEVSEVFRFNRRQLIFLIYLPSAMPSILTGIHLALIYSWLATIGAEYFMAAGPGIGALAACYQGRVRHLHARWTARADRLREPHGLQALQGLQECPELRGAPYHDDGARCDRKHSRQIVDCRYDQEEMNLCAAGQIFARVFRNPQGANEAPLLFGPTCRDTASHSSVHVWHDHSRTRGKQQCR